jgi:hypothetical protein
MSGLETMNDTSKLARDVLIVALLLGIAGDSLLRTGPWSLNLTLWVAAVLAGVLMLAARHDIEWPRDTAWLLAPALLFAAGFSWHDSPFLKFIDLFAVGLLLSIWSLSLDRVRIPVCSILDYVRGVVNTGFAAAQGAAPIAVRKIPVAAPPRSERWRHARAAAVGLLIAFPLVFIFGGLLMAADAVFDQMVTTALDIDFEQLASHAILTAFFAWIVCGFFLAVFEISKPKVGDSLAVERPKVGIIEIGVPLGLINLLFLVFVIVQLRYLFGDSSLVQETVGMTYAEYARRGFFELVTVAALVLPVLLTADWLLAGTNRRSLAIFRGLASLMLILLLLIVISALKRMHLYQSVYGLTELRLYTTAFMAWLGIVLIWLAVTVLKDRRQYFATGAALAGFCLIAALNILNPDALIARVNTTRALEGNEFDAHYAASLSADALPTLVGAFDTLSHEDRCILSDRLLTRWSLEDEGDWRVWNASRSRALRIVADNRELLSPVACTNLLGVASRQAAAEMLGQPVFKR